MTALVADCSQAGIDYTEDSVRQRIRLVADCSQAGIDYTRNKIDLLQGRLRIARRRGSITLTFDDR